MKTTRKITDTMIWAASSDVSINLPNDGLITRIDLEAYTTGGSAIAGALAPLGLWRIIQNLKIQGGAGKDFFSMSGTQMGQLLHHLNLLDFPGTTWKDLVATSQYQAFRLHFGSRPRDIYGRDNPFDLTVAIPAFAEGNNSLKLIWTTTAAADTIDGAVDISAAVIRATVHSVKDEDAEWARFGRKVPTSTTLAHDPSATASDLQSEVNVPVGAYVRRIGIMSQDDTAAGSNGPLIVGDQATEIGLKLTKDNIRLIHTRTKTREVCGSPVYDGGIIVDTPNTQDPFSQAGLHVLDLRQYDHRDFGLNCIGLQTGDVKLSFTIGSYASAEIEHIWFDQVQSWAG